MKISNNAVVKALAVSLVMLISKACWLRPTAVVSMLSRHSKVGVPTKTVPST